MDPSNPYRPRVSRETRLLLTAGVMAVAALWLLARIRFEERPLTPNPVPAVLAQLGTEPGYGDLAAEIAQLQTRVEPALVAVDVPSSVPGSLEASRRVLALRLRDDLAVALLPAGPGPEPPNDSRVLARDGASGLLVVRVPGQVPGPLPVPWTPRQLQRPRYLIVSDPSSPRVSLRPVFVGALDPVENPFWSEPVWAVPAHVDLAPGSFVFTDNAELVGLVFPSGAGSAVVPSATILAESERLLNTRRDPPGAIGVEVQAVTEALASATGAQAGVVVTWVEPEGAAAGRLAVGDVIEAVDGRALLTGQHWNVRLARLLAEETLTLRVRRSGEVREVSVRATAAVAPPALSRRQLGLTLRGRRGIGAEVVGVERGSAAERAGLLAGDLITMAGDVSTPTPAQIREVFSTLREGRRAMIAVTRGDAHHVTTLEP